MLTIRDLGIHRGGRELFRGLQLTLAPGEVLVVLGPNGVGKSSLLLALAGMLPATGEIALAGKALATMSRREIAAQIAWQGELPPTEFGLTVAQRLWLAAPEAADMTTVLRQLDLADMCHRPLGEMSSGERQRVELAAVMLRDAPIWLLDEPTAHLDLKHQAAWLTMMRRQAAEGRAIVVVLHDVQQAASVATSVVLIDVHGGASFGTAEAMLTPARLSALYGVRLLQWKHAGRRLLIPDVAGGGNETA